FRPSFGAGCPSRRPREVGGSVARQWMNSPLGASGSATSSVRVRVPGGGAVQRRGGETPFPSQVYRTGIWPPVANAGLESAIAAAARRCTSAAGRDVLCGARFLEGGLRRRQARDRHAERRAGDVVQPELLAE